MLRRKISQFPAAAQQDRALSKKGLLEDELDTEISDNVAMAGDCFHRLLRMLSGAP